MAPKPTLAHAAFVRREGVSLAGASVAFVSVEGAPAAMSASFSQIMTREAKARDIVVAEPRKARYLVRGYLSAYVTADGAAVEYVWDVFDQDKQRMQRVNDVLEVKGEGDDPWAHRRRGGADERRRQERRRPRRLSLQHARGEAAAAPAPAIAVRTASR